MAFDGRDYFTAGPTYPVVYQAGAPLVGIALAKPLTAAHCYARNHGRRILQQTYPFNFRAPDTSLLTLIQAAEPGTRIAEGVRRIPDGTTHLVAEVFFRVWSKAQQNEAHHKLQAATATDFDEGSDTVMDLPALQPPGWWYTTRDLSLDGFYGGNSYIARCEVELQTVGAGVFAEIALEAYSLGGGDYQPYTPHHVLVWGEVR